jgi:hypothetical protein
MFRTILTAALKPLIFLFGSNFFALMSFFRSKISQSSDCCFRTTNHSRSGGQLMRARFAYALSSIYSEGLVGFSLDDRKRIITLLA